MAENIVFTISADTQGLGATITLLEKIGQVDKKTAEQFRAATEEYKKSQNILTDTAAAQAKASNQFAGQAKGIDLLSDALKKLGIAIPKDSLNQFAEGVLLGLQDAMNDAGVATKGTVKTFEDLKRVVTGVGGKNLLGSTLDQAGNIAKTNNALQTLKQRVLEAKNEAQKLESQFGANAAQTIAAQKELAGLTHELDEFNKRTKAFNPENKFAAVSSAFQGIAGSVAIASGALTLFGADTKEAEELTKKLDAALKLTAGFSAITQLGGEFKNLGLALGLLQPQIAKTAAANVVLTETQIAAGVSANAAAAGTTAFSTALRISPLGIFLTVLTAAAAAYIILADSAKEASASTVALNEAKEKAIESSSQERAEITLLVKEYESANTSQKRRTEIISQLQSDYPAYFGSLKLEGESVYNVRAAYEKLTQALIIKAQMDAIIQKIAEVNTEQLISQNKSIDDQLTAFQRFLGLDDKLKKTLVDGKNKVAKKEVDDLTNAYLKLAEQLTAIGGDPSNKPEKEQKEKTPRIKAIRQAVEDEAKLIEKLRSEELARDIENLKVYIAARKTTINESADSQEEKEKQLSALQLAELKLRLLYYQQYGKDTGEVLNQIADYESRLQKSAADAEEKRLKDIENASKIQAADDEQRKKDELKAQEEFEKKRNEIILQAGLEIANGIFEITQASIANQIDELNKQQDLENELRDKAIQANQTAFDKRRITAREFRATEEKLNKEKVASEEAAQRRINDLKRKADIANRAQKLFEIAVATARNIAETPLLALFYGLLGAAQAGIVLATPLPKYAKGTLNLQGKNDEVPIIAHRGEAITPVKQSKEYNTTLAAIHNRSIPAFALNDFVKNFTVRDMPSYTSTSTSNFSINEDSLAEKIAKNMAWELRGSGDVRIKNWKQLADAMNSQSDERRNRA